MADYALANPDIPADVDYHAKYGGGDFSNLIPGTWEILKNVNGYADPCWLYNPDPETQPVLHVDNMEMPTIKHVWVEIEMWDQTYLPFGYELELNASGSVILVDDSGWFEPRDDYYVRTWHWTIDPQPAFEEIDFDPLISSMVGYSSTLEITHRCRL